MATESSEGRRITLRSLIVGTAATAFLAWFAPYVMHVLHASYLALDFSTPGATAVLFVLVAVANPVLRRIRASWALESGELVVIYTMLLLASAVIEMGLASQILPIVATPAYYHTPENKWHELFMDRLPAGVALRDPEAAKRFFEGAPQAAIDWASWLPVLLVWAPMLLALYATMMATMVLLRRQWDDRERLAYPLTQVPLALVDRREPITRNRLMWIGFAIPFVVSALQGLHYYVPAVPALTLSKSIPVFGKGGGMIFRLSFPMLGFFFMVNQDAAFSLWAFNLLFTVVKAFMLKTGMELKVNLGIYGTSFATYKYLGWGAMVALALGTLYTGRQHFSEVLRKAFGRAPEVDDRDEAMSYRAAVWTVILGLAVMTFWLNWTGLKVGLALYFVVMAFIIFIGLTRVVVESGLAEAVAPVIAPDSVVALFGNSALGLKGHAALAMTYVYSSDIRTYVMASAASALKLFQGAGMRGRSLTAVMAWGVLVGLVVSIWSTLAMAYRYGGATMNNWFFVNGPKQPFDWLGKLLATPQDVQPAGLTVAAFGGLVMLGLMAARQTFWWWPLHPVGWAVGSTWIMNELWFTCMLAWMLKLFVIRAGGLRLYRSARPVAIGLILGQFTANFVWAVIDHFAGTTGNVIFWI